MKKYTILFVVFAVFALTACGSGSTTTQSTDSTAAPLVDSTSAPVEGGNAGGGVVDESGKDSSHGTVEEIK
jgi:hypothetical protein